MAGQTIVNRFYPQLSNVISTDELPDFLSFVENDLDSLLESIFYNLPVVGVFHTTRNFTLSSANQ